MHKKFLRTLNCTAPVILACFVYFSPTCLCPVESMDEYERKRIQRERKDAREAAEDAYVRSLPIDQWHEVSRELSRLSSCHPSIKSRYLKDHKKRNQNKEDREKEQRDNQLKSQLSWESQYKVDSWSNPGGGQSNYKKNYKKKETPAEYRARHARVEGTITTIITPAASPEGSFSPGMNFTPSGWDNIE